MCERPAVQFGEGDAQVRPLHHGKVRRVAAVQHVHQPHLVIDPPQHSPNDLQYYEMKRHQPSKWKKRTDRNTDRCDPEMLCHRL